MPDVITGWRSDELSRVPRGPGVTFKYVFGPDSPPGQIFSRRVLLTENRLYFFRAHNVPDGRSIFLNWVSLEHSEPLDGCQTPDALPPGRDVYIQRMTLGDPDRWILTAERPQMMINLPGVYRFELSDEDMLGGDLCLEYSSVRCVPGAPLGVAL